MPVLPALVSVSGAAEALQVKFVCSLEVTMTLVMPVDYQVVGFPDFSRFESRS
jgi:hypothetical protein